jgi:hypothetical protein
MFHMLPTVCIVVCVTAKYFRINSINRLNLIIFLLKSKCVLSKLEIKFLYII